ncbi:hypothetical protein L2D37_26175 [Vibrio harveyi]|uniref:hypothetical protein n=1 Tax=Vibrio harveyi TaxID=669 RepID=UPI003BB6578B
MSYLGLALVCFFGYEENLLGMLLFISSMVWVITTYTGQEALELYLVGFIVNTVIAIVGMIGDGANIKALFDFNGLTYVDTELWSNTAISNFCFLLLPIGTTFAYFMYRKCS